MTVPEMSIRRPVATLVVLAALFVLGAIALDRLPLAFMPATEERSLFVIAEYPGASPAAIERLIVRPLEDALSGMSGMIHMWSHCGDDGGRVHLSFAWRVDMPAARAEVRDRVERVRRELPQDLERVVISPSWDPRSTGESVVEARIASGRNLSSDYDLLDRKIVRPLVRIPGVASVILDGVNPREVRINLRQEALRRFNLDPRRVLRSLRDNGEDRSLGVVREGEQRFLLRAPAAVKGLAAIADLPIIGTALTVADVADITFAEAPREYGRHLDGAFAIALEVVKEPSANAVEVTRAVRARLDSMAEDSELEGINVLVWHDQGEEITKTIRDLEQTGIMGAVLASIVLFLFLRSVPATLVAVACIPLSLLVACGVVWLQGRTLNTLTLLGLIVGVGMLVDNAVVVMENVHRYQEKGLESRGASLLGAREVSLAVIAATLTSVIVFSPLLFNKPTMMNVILKELAMTVCATLLASLLVSQTLIPIAASRMATYAPGADRAKLPMARLQRAYARAMRLTLRHLWLAPLLGVAVLASAIYPFQHIEKNFETNQSEMFVGIQYNISEPLSLDEKEILVNAVETQLRPHQSELEVKSIYSFWSAGFTTTRLYMTDGHNNEAQMATVRSRLPELLPQIPGLQLEVMDSTPFWQRNRGKRITAQLVGPDSEALADLAAEGRRLIEAIPGFTNAYTSTEGGSLEIHTRVDRERARAYGIAVEQPAEVLSLTLRGRDLPVLTTPSGDVRVRLVLEDGAIRGLDDLKSVALLRASLAPVPVETVATFGVVKSAEGIQRDDKVTGVWVGARFEEGTKEERTKQLQDALSTIALPPGFQWDFLSFASQREESQREFLTNLALALGLVFAVMAALFESMRQALSLMVALPFAVAGAFWALYATGTDFDQPASVGLLLLLGIVVNNGIVMIEHINHYRRRGMDRPAAMIRGGAERLRPILMTALTTLIGLVPMAVQQPSLGGIYYYSLALVIMGGLTISTILTALLLPATVCIAEDLPAWARRRIQGAGRRLSRPWRPATGT
ncbi:MAG: efflux RND transporter permease subunit [Candidatus Schekmanbacteria bacterium]|nr:efflux RND transporter permease subunit [Candidatus Schekmanbacteria bacterium]